MANKGRINKMARVKKLVAKQADKRQALKEELKKARTGEIDFARVMEINAEMSALPKNGAKVRLHNRCMYDGRPRGFMRKFGMNRVLFRKLASEGKIPGVTKSSW